MTDSILIVEDEGITALHLRTLLTNWGFAISGVTESAEKITDLIAAEPPDLVLMDIRLKGEMDGIEAANLIRRRFGIPVVFLTAHHDQSTRQRIEASHAYGLVVKPFKDREVYVAVKSALQRRRIELALAREKNGGSPPELPELGDGVVATDAEGRIAYMNEAAEKLTGWKDFDAFEHEATDVLRLNEAESGALIAHPVSNILRNADTSEPPRDSILTSKSGSSQPTSHRVNPVRDGSGDLVGAVVTIRPRKEHPLDNVPVSEGTPIDAVTGIAPPGLLEDFLSDATARARNRQTMVAVFYIRIDRLPATTESLGPEAETELLTKAAVRLQESVRAADPVARVHNDSFVVVQPNLEHAGGAVTLGEKLARVFQRPFIVGNQELCLEAGVGAALFPIDGTVPDRLIRQAEEASGQAAGSGPDRFHFFSEKVESVITTERTLGEDLESALKENQLDVLFQPVFDLTTRRIVGAEVRQQWHHPKRGVIPSSAFLPLAERHGIASSITEWTIREVLRRTAGWRPVAPGIRVSVPLSGSEIRRRNLVPHLVGILEETGFEAHRLAITLGEEVLVTQPPMTTHLNLQRLRQLGVHLTLDHFGSEYASMMILKKTPVHGIKIDGSLVAVVPHEKEVQAIVRAAIDLARSCGLEFSASGIEDESQRRWLRYHGCEIGQGRFLSDFLSGKDVFQRLVDQRL